MPPRKVYGKSRAIYDPHGVFDSPQRSTPTAVKNSNIDVLTPKLCRLAVKDAFEAQICRDYRKALGEVNVNRTVLPSGPNQSTTARRRKKLVVEDSSDDNENWEHKITAGETDGCPASAVPRHNEDKLCRPTSSTIEDNTSIHNQSLRPPATDKAATLDQPDQPTLQEDPNAAVPLRLSPVRDEYYNHCSGLLELSSHGISTFSDWCDALTEHFHITKIAEASFSEVYRLSLLSEFSDLSSNDESVFKIIPLRPPDNTLPEQQRQRNAALKKMENMSLPDHVANEVKLLLRMGSIPGFTNFRDVRVIQGRPPKAFTKAFKDFNAAQKKRKKELSFFPDPSKKTSYAKDQLWAAIEMQDAGIDLEQLVENNDCNSIWQVWDVFWQVALSLAKGEEGAEFEHRDLHLGNICVRLPSEEIVEWDQKRKLNFTGLETTIIDYTISRARMQDETIAFHNLAIDATLFEGDSTEEYQYDIYRFMRGAILLDDPYADFSNRTPRKDRTWEQYHPVTNLIWLHFVLYKLLEQVEWPSATKTPPRRRKEEYVKWKRANDLEHILLRVRDLLDPERMCQSLLTSTSDLVHLAIRECWLDCEDVENGVDYETGLSEQLGALGIGSITKIRNEN